MGWEWDVKVISPCHWNMKYAQDVCDQYRPFSLDTAKNDLLNKYSSNFYLGQVWSMTCHVLQFRHGKKINDERRFKTQKTEKLCWKVKTSEEKENKSCSNEEID